MFRSARTKIRSHSVIGVAAAVVGLTLSALAVAPSASAAGWGSCYRQGNSWSFKHYTGSSGGTSDIDAWHNTTCSGGSVLRGRVIYRTSQRHVDIYAFDFKADNYAVTVYTHGPSVTSNGNGSSVHGGGSLSSFQTPYNFWIRVGNQANSVSQPFPL